MGGNYIDRKEWDWKWCYSELLGISLVYFKNKVVSVVLKFTSEHKAEASDRVKLFIIKKKYIL